MAYRGMGVYALALQTVLASLLRVVLLWIFAKWITKEKFDKHSLAKLWSFGSKLLGENLIGTFFSQVYSDVYKRQDWYTWLSLYKYNDGRAGSTFAFRRR